MPISLKKSPFQVVDFLRRERVAEWTGIRPLAYPGSNIQTGERVESVDRAIYQLPPGFVRAGQPEKKS